VKVREIITKLGFDIDQKKLDAYDKSLKDTKSNLEKLSKTSKDIGGKLTLGFALPAIALGAFAVKLSSDAEEITSKFNVIFKDIREQSDLTARKLAHDYGLSITKSKELLGNTSDLLTGFGFTQKSALDLSNQVNQLAVDLASFNNFSGGAEGASAALTKALLGERESIKSLGITINEEMVKRKIAINSTKGLTFETERQAKVFATLQLAQEQSLNAIGDTARTMDTFAAKMRIFKFRLQDLGEAFGKILLPFANKLLDVTTKLVVSFANLSPGVQKAIVAITALGAAISFGLLGFGLFIGAITPAIKVLGLLSTAYRAVAVSAAVAHGSIFAIPIAIGAAIAGTILLIEDLFSYFQGKESVFGKIFQFIETMGIRMVNKFDEFIMMIIDKIKSIPSMLSSSLGSFGNFLLDTVGTMPIQPALSMGRQMQNQSNNFNIKVDSPITVNGSDDPEKTGGIIKDKIANELQAEIYKATVNNNLVMEY